MIHSIVLRILMLLGLGAMLAACGGAGGPGAAGPTASSSGAPAAAGSGAPTASPALSLDAIPQGLTPEGYHVLGRDDAPVTITDYSDFL